VGPLAEVEQYLLDERSQCEATIVPRDGNRQTRWLAKHQAYSQCFLQLEVSFRSTHRHQHPFFLTAYQHQHCLFENRFIYSASAALTISNLGDYKNCFHHCINNRIPYSEAMQQRS